MLEKHEIEDLGVFGVEREFGRVERPDPRDNDYTIAELLEKFDNEDVEEVKLWWDDSVWGDQGTTTMCVAYAWMHWLEDGPVIQGEPKDEPLVDVEKLYKLAQKNDRWEGEDYPGTSVRAGAKVLKSLGLISEYRWATTLDEVVKTVQHLGPVVVGTKWYAQMNRPNPASGQMYARGRLIGGHAYVINGVDTNRERLRIKNSWGKSWGDGGHGWISFRDFEKLLKDGGEACIALEVQFDEKHVDIGPILNENFKNGKKKTSKKRASKKGEVKQAAVKPTPTKRGKKTTKTSIVSKLKNAITGKG